MKTSLPLILFSLLLTGCGIFDVHKINIDQGNIVTQDTINDLKIGMTKRQVIFVLGTPLVTDPFNSDLWAYYYGVEVNRGSKKYQQRIILKFEDNKLLSIDGDLQPEQPVPESANSEPKPTI